MITYFPTIYTDELLYSQLARCYTKSGYLAYRFAAEDLFQSKTVRPDIEFLNAYTPEALQMITRTMPIGDIVMHHTMFPYYGRFIKPERRRQAFDSLVNMGTEYHNLLAIPKSKDCISRHLRYCPECIKDDRNKYGETYWHRIHQMVGVNICPIHHCYLIDSDIVTSSNVSPSLITAEDVVKIPNEIVFSSNNIECRLAEYTAEVFQSVVDLQADIPTGKFLHSRMEGTKYLSQRGEQRNMTLFHADFLEYYKALPSNPLNQQWQLGKIFSNNRHNTHEICMLAMFIGVSPYDLTHIELPEQSQQAQFDVKIKELHAEGLNYQQIANQLNASYDVVKSIGEGLYGAYHYHTTSSKNGSSRKSNWEQIDFATLPLVKDAISKLQGDGTTRPVKISIGTIERYLKLPKNGLRNYPMCRAEIQKHTETQEQYWAREVVWATNYLIQNGKALNLTNIKKLINIRTENFIACFSFLDTFTRDNVVDKLRKVLDENSKFLSNK